MPSWITATSADVPPTSKLSTSEAPTRAATSAAPMTPEAVPESSIATGSVLPSAAAMIPPFDLVIIGGAGTPASRSAFSSEPMYAATRRCT